VIKFVFVVILEGFYRVNPFFFFFFVKKIYDKTMMSCAFSMRYMVKTHSEEKQLHIYIYRLASLIIQLLQMWRSNLNYDSFFKEDQIN
jgi:hypothetical protein